jgi:pyruvate dehydrogenase E2 component (dihydrolipoamide acetyltransferase)
MKAFPHPGSPARRDRFQELGGYGIEHFTPILNPPEAGILGVGASYETPAFKGDDYKINPAGSSSSALTVFRKSAAGAPSHTL